MSLDTMLCTRGSWRLHESWFWSKSSTRIWYFSYYLRVRTAQASLLTKTETYSGYRHYSVINIGSSLNLHLCLRSRWELFLCTKSCCLCHLWIKRAILWWTMSRVLKTAKLWINLGMGTGYYRWLRMLSLILLLNTHLQWLTYLIAFLDCS